MSGERIPLADHVADAVALLAGVRTTEVIALDGAATGRVAAAELRSRVDVPGADNSQMDGYAASAADLGGDGEEVTLPLGDVIAAGDAPGTLAPGTARAIMTGAPIPGGADLVIPVEESAAGRFAPTDGSGRSADGDEVDRGAADGVAADGRAADATVTLTPTSTAFGRFVRPRGSDTRAGDTVLREGRLLTPARIAHLAVCGLRDVEVEARLRVIVLSTGSEVTGPSADAPAPGGVHDANGPGLAAALTEAGAEVVHVGAVRDDADVLLGHLREQVARHDADLVVTSGGVSQGAFEVVRHAAAHRGVTLAFPTVAMQPGGPQGIGTLEVDGRRVPWLAFPGNPVSALLSCELIARPALGAPPRRRLHLPVQLEADEPSPSRLDQYRRARVLPSGRVRLVGGPSSHLIGGYAAADALARIPVGTATLRDGDMVETLLIPGGDA
ncbi:molybdopterin molybdotransferase MoeA [Brachybacterium aquaticum]|uniref:Molybdopterin molybdenumtransferase n=1 Tax=Brachybacterium aquaticum TaxID=1432564 RepID=A0A841AE80_9MICO|nr:gephyrin-like molybdotransferase Glp [Brachybacterium aquaticum]MBB5832237.1 molybdopterin molybdotransferase [Brachybacterium aquaticum]